MSTDTEAEKEIPTQSEINQQTSTEQLPSHHVSLSHGDTQSVNMDPPTSETNESPIDAAQGANDGTVYHDYATSKVIESQPSTSTSTLPAKNKEIIEDENNCHKCLTYTALVIALLAVIIAILPLIVYYAGDYVKTEPSSIYGAAAPNQDLLTIIKRYHHHTYITQERPDFDFIFDEPMTHSESWGDYNKTGRDIFVGSYRGWEYIWGWDFEHNYDDTDDHGIIGGWAAGNDQWQKYPLEDL